MCGDDSSGYGFWLGVASTYLFKTRGIIYGIHIASFVLNIIF